MVGVGRRVVLRGGLAAALLPLTASALVTASAASPAAIGIGAVGRGVLEAAVGAAIRVLGAEGVVTGTLDRVDDLLRAPAGHPHAFAARFLLDSDARALLESGLVDVLLPGARVTGVGLHLVDGDDGAVAVMHVDRRPVSEHRVALTP